MGDWRTESSIHGLGGFPLIRDLCESRLTITLMLSANVISGVSAPAIKEDDRPSSWKPSSTSAGGTMFSLDCDLLFRSCFPFISITALKSGIIFCSISRLNISAKWECH